MILNCLALLKPFARMSLRSLSFLLTYGTHSFHSWLILMAKELVSFPTPTPTIHLFGPLSFPCPCLQVRFFLFHRFFRQYFLNVPFISLTHIILSFTVFEKLLPRIFACNILIVHIIRRLHNILRESDSTSNPAPCFYPPRNRRLWKFCQLWILSFPFFGLTSGTWFFPEKWECIGDDDGAVCGSEKGGRSGGCTRSEKVREAIGLADGARCGNERSFGGKDGVV
mmetsp:Transcript_9423/g.15366  ORF Transcript_9423/g.15366 Transcript_9423/m.15366 type:complete len:225 (-) Transcript_9423:389-1063(-)